MATRPYVTNIRKTTGRPTYKLPLTANTGIALIFTKISYFFAATIILLGMFLAPACAKYASIVIDVNTARVYHELNADTRNYPASLTKMMTTYMLFEALSDGEVQLNTPMRVSARASRQPSSKLWLEPGSSISVELAIRALITKSANDVAVVVAEHLGGTERKFAKLMTLKAKTIGMNRTNFRNASGLPNRHQLSTARDIAKLAIRLYRDFPEYYHYFARTQFTFRGTTFRSHNKVLQKYNGADGLKTGYISASGFNIAVSAVRGHNRIVGILFGGRTAKTRDRHIQSLMDRSFVAAANYSQPPTPHRKPLLHLSADKPSGSINMKNRAYLSEAMLRNWGIQVGAYSESDRALVLARTDAVRLKGQYPKSYAHIEEVDKKGKRLYRAQIRGLHRIETNAACQLLEKALTDCQTIKTIISNLAQTRKTSCLDSC